MNFKSLYIYALYWVLTVITTVGYGHANYQTSTEYLYTCFLEIIATITQAYLISILTTSLMITKFSFKQLLYERMSESDEWIVKIERKTEYKHKLPRSLTDEMYESFMESFSSDHNMIIEEYAFYSELPPKH